MRYSDRTSMRLKHSRDPPEPTSFLVWAELSVLTARSEHQRRLVASVVSLSSSSLEETSLRAVGSNHRRSRFWISEEEEDGKVSQEQQAEE